MPCGNLTHTIHSVSTLMLKFRQIADGFNAQTIEFECQKCLQSWFLTFAGIPIGYNGSVLPL